jgi:3-hydroxybutyryl-CoA dehydrogenase
MWPRRSKPNKTAKALTTVAIIGAGPLGRWLALSAARAGYRVLLEDVMPAKLALASKAAADFKADQDSVEFVSTVEDAVRDADLAIDCVPDELESKLEILWLLDRMAPPKMVIATPTTQLSIADLASCTYRPDRCVAIAADPRVLVEGTPTEILLRITEQTHLDAALLVTEFWQSLGLTPRVEVAA